MRRRTRRSRTLRLAPARLHRRWRRLAAAGPGEQGLEEEGASVAAEVRVRGRRELRWRRSGMGGDGGVRDLLVGVRRRRRDPGVAAVRPRVPRGVHRHVARVPLLVPVLPAGAGGGKVPEVREVSGRRRRRRRRQSSG